MKAKHKPQQLPLVVRRYIEDLNKRSGSKKVILGRRPTGDLLIYF